MPNKAADKLVRISGDAIAQWIRLCLSYICHGFESTLYSQICALFVMLKNVGLAH